MEPAKPRPLERISADDWVGRANASLAESGKADIDAGHLRANYIYPTVMLKTLLRKLKESTTWIGLAVVAQFVPLGMDELQAIWSVITGIAGLVLMFLDEPKTVREKDAEKGG